MKRIVKPLIFIFSLFLILNTSIIFLNAPNHHRYLLKKMSVDVPVKRSGLIKHVYILLVDGLRYDSMQRDMEFTKRLISTGEACLFKAKFDGPSYSRPGYARIFTGSPTINNGIWSNNQEERCKKVSIFETARRSGLSTGACAYYWVGQLFNSKTLTDRINFDKVENIQYSYFYGSEEEHDIDIFNNGMRIINNYKPNLFLMHFMESDIAGHRFGGTSLEYSESVVNTDKLIESFFSKIDMHDSLVMIISDHGHTDKGGHGGSSSKEVDVPIIIAGDIIKGGIYNELLDHIDIAPTVCMLLDLPLTTQMPRKPIDFVFK